MEIMFLDEGEPIRPALEAGDVLKILLLANIGNKGDGFMPLL